ncbi:MAG: hypothetical protein A2233_05630 [Candidatus Kerfeldbacteria bacterium RIFOXYA2_FULL_38_24]|uniref:Uncharacterized protein n=1 Tax=Candidatus Kerfeldbacteria bacterium RIFOXYB2_FULL_38_14 TaxID=1798547 RepID=A0A1G2BAJ6_9BACT|nr:MAG: hypothetical protein A2233_05630 [Candidatus Kerfeldbacteria bacterium RIFOXYA2_FULL_38_24]OGY86233.1 MAG: hypothetical protein A2319_01175 [Candidatus Kerfeldbacteria bacterium RIFOXYB2_FULL_38_14]OGY88611.1 MAG: hypothetical protein A2458_00550 [Candidatus Kerfeldbacteria bacterium RIFOXYC2_FULL_38_9]
MKVYHYSHLSNWQNIQRGSWKSDNKPGLGAYRRIGQDDMEACNTKAVFALLEPLPDNWINNEHFKGVWDYFRYDIGTLLLEIEIDPEKDQIFMADRGHVEGVLYYEDKEGIPEKYLHPSRREGERSYMESKIPLKDYLEKAKDLRYSMPEVIITEDVPLEKIRISEQQPLIEDELRKCGEKFRQMLIRDIQSVPELSQWYKQREHDKELQEGKRGFGEKLK